MAAVYTADVRAQESDPVFHFSGFGTLGIAHSSEDNADFLAHDLQKKGAGAHESWSMEVDSKIGLQFSADLTSKFSAVLQVVSEQQYDGTFRPQIEWANLKYDITSDLSVRVGRVVLGSFLTSDYRKVGYSTPWVRPPVEVYGLIPLSHSDGIDLSYHAIFGEVNSTLHAAFGKASARHPAGGKVESEGGAWHFSNTVEYGPATMRLAYTHSHLTAEPYEELFDGYRTFADQLATAPFGLGNSAAAQANAIAHKYNTEDKRFTFFSIGAMYDPGKWFVMAEWGQTDSDSLLGKRQAWYATGGYRLGAFTPYVTYAEAKLKSNQSDPGVDVPPILGPVAVGTGAFLDSQLNSIEGLAGAPIQKTISFGLRWDVTKNTALKVQYDYSRVDDGSPGTLNYIQPGFKTGDDFEVFSATFDFVF
ncbi:MAG TPA: porin [Burkholderiales bacterium]|nr:porin [Burkholderiales bacterium]